MKLTELVAKETQTPHEALMLLRHGSNVVRSLRRHGASIEEFTSIQPIDSRYDFFHSSNARISIVVVVVDAMVYGVYRVGEVEDEGTNYSLASEACRRYESERGTPPMRCRKFTLRPLPSVAVGLPVRGWMGRARTTVQRHTDSFFAEIEVYPPEGEDLKEAIERSFRRRVSDSMNDTREERLRRLAGAERRPRRIEVPTVVFTRNPDVVAEVLLQADGICQACGSPAPFMRRSNNTPYLEVHHKQPLAEQGEDTVENATALCPNCHRKAHYG